MELKQLFEGVEGLSEDFHLKLETMVESKVADRVEANIKEIKEEADASVAQEKEKLAEASKQYAEYIKTELVESMTAFVAKTAQSWLAENQVAIVAESKVEMAESIISTVGDLFKQNGLKLDEAQETALTKTQADLAEATARLETLSAELSTLKEAKYQADKKTLAESILAGLADTQKEKATKLAESFGDIDLEVFKDRLTVVRSIVEGKEQPKAQEETVVESVREVAPQKDPLMEAINAHFKR